MCKPNLAPCKPNSAICKLFFSICKPSNLCDSKEFCKFLNTNTLFWCVLYVPIIPGSICWGHFFECKPNFFGLHWFTLVYTGLPPDDVPLAASQTSADWPMPLSPRLLLWIARHRRGMHGPARSGQNRSAAHAWSKDFKAKMKMESRQGRPDPRRQFLGLVPWTRSV